MLVHAQVFICIRVYICVFFSYESIFVYIDVDMDTDVYCELCLCEPFPQIIPLWGSDFDQGVTKNVAHVCFRACMHVFAKCRKSQTRNRTVE